MKNSASDMFSDERKDDYLTALKSWVKNLKEGKGSIALIKDVENQIKNLEGETGKLPFKTNPVHGIPEYIKQNKKEYIESVYNYIIYKDTFNKNKAFTAEKNIKKTMTKDRYKAFIKSFKAVIQAGIKRGQAYMKSKPYLTLLNKLDKNVDSKYIISEINNPAKRPDENIKKNKAKELFREFHHYDADKTKVVKIELPGMTGKLDVMHLGKMPKLWYTSDKDINNTGTREKFTYVHGLKPHLDIYVDPAKTILIIPLDGQDITERGLLAMPGKRVQK